jgi:hypothetical protein
MLIKKKQTASNLLLTPVAECLQAAKALRPLTVLKAMTAEAAFFARKMTVVNR